MDNDFVKRLFNEHQKSKKLPSPKKVSNWVENILAILFPGACEINFESESEIEYFLNQLKNDLKNILLFNEITEKSNVIKSFFAELSNIKAMLDKDIEGIFQGDPAAKSYAEITRAYPGFYAIASHRIAHFLYEKNVEIIPRMIGELSKSKTGIDIHPGAKIGEYFCIDHGTGVVIGETSIIGSHVKLYQGVTLGALSIAKQDAAMKRHPTIEDNVVVYAGATILGGKTIVGKNSVIGGNVWITKSVPAESKLYYKAENQNY
jgi:serine O-acetyltransferase